MISHCVWEGESTLVAGIPPLADEDVNESTIVLQQNNDNEMKRIL